MIEQEKSEEISDRDIAALRDVQVATVNILEDFNAEKERLENTQRAVLNILDDFDTEKGQLQITQRATVNILEDFNAEKEHLENTQRAVLNILDDFDTEKSKVEQVNYMLQIRSEELNRSNEELQKAHDVLEARVQERTAELKQSNVQLLDEMEEHKKAEEEIKYLNEDLMRRAAELEASNKELESFSYSVSHDLRTPLRAMDGFSQAMLEDYADKVDSQGKEYLQYIRSSSQLMAKLIDDLLNLSRITRAEITLEKVNLSDLAMEVANELQRTQPERRADFIITPRLEALGDRHLLKLVLENLLGNAFKFTSKRPVAKIEFGVTQSNGDQAYFVRDNGVGFDMNYVDKLFKPFQRLHRIEDFSGTGIGLASVYRIINRLGGRVWAEGGIDGGAAFYFTLRKSQFI